MSDIAIRVENLSKRYRIGQGVKARYDTLYDKLAGVLRTPWRLLRGNGRAQEEYIWALKDVSFEVKRGEVVGIIGRNGAGKSTLLKILSRITEPTSGRAEVYGRVGSLLEVGTGFHPELTGRENIYLNGAILGMKKAEIDRKFDEIVAFAELDTFIDTPVKFYSSGMYVRLAFAVAAHLEPEILLVDEVLAVGDVAFQKKCLGKMGDVASEGRTVLFVSHNLEAIRSLCERAIWLHEGQLMVEGDSDVVIARYLSSADAVAPRNGEVIFGPETERRGSGIARMVRARILDKRGKPTSQVPMGEGFAVEIEFVCNRPLRKGLIFGIGIENQLHQRLISIDSQETYGELPSATRGGLAKVDIETQNLLPGRYFITLGIATDRHGNLDWIPDALAVDVVPRAVYPTGKIPSARSGIVFVKASWQFSYS